MTEILVYAAATAILVAAAVWEWRNVKRRERLAHADAEVKAMLDRKIAEKRIYPAIDLGASGTRKEERILPAEMLERITLLRRTLMQMRPAEAMEHLVKQLGKTDSNEEFLEMVGKFVK